MLTQPTIDKLHELKLLGMASGLDEQRQNPTAFADLDFDDRDVRAVLGGRQAFVESLGLSYRARKTVQDIALAAVGATHPVEEHVEHELVGDQLALLHVGLGLPTELGATPQIRPEQISGRYMRQTEGLRKPLGLRSFSGTWCAEQDHDVGG